MADRPNVVVVMTDQQRADATAREGFDLDTTPFLDRMAAGGTWFDRAYTSTPVCAPARVSFLTGRYPSATRVQDNHSTDAATYDRDLFDVANDAGYATAMVGKNHSHLDESRVDHWFPLSHWGALDGAKPERTEREAEFEEWLSGLSIFEDGGGFSPDPTPFPPETQCAARCVSNAQSWIDSLDDEPFCLWLSFPEPHNPFQVPEPYYSMFPPDELPPVEAGVEELDARRFAWRWAREIAEERVRRKLPDADYDELLPRLRANYYGMLRLIDDQVRRFVGFLDERGIREDTLIVFCSDHGDYVGEYGMMRKAVGLPEATTRIPLVVSGPGVETSDGPHPAHVSLVDLMPTICDAIGEPIPTGVQGRSLWPFLAGEEYPEAEFESVSAEAGFGGLYHAAEDAPEVSEVSTDELNTYTQCGSTSMVRKGDWKLVADMMGDLRLYDVAADPAERRDRSDDPAVESTRSDLLEELVEWTLRVRDPLPAPGEYELKSDPRNYYAPHGE